MKKTSIFILALFTMALPFSSISAKKKTPVSANGRLQVIGNQLCNKEGKPIALHGASLGWHNIWPRFYTAKTVKWLTDDWKCNVVRAAMGLQIEDNYRENPEFALKCMTQVIDASIKNGIYVIIDFHAHKEHLNEAKTFFKQMATKYGKHPNIIYEIWNEPDDEYVWSDVKNYAEQVIPVIRSIDPNNIILVCNPRWDQEVDKVALDPIMGQKNIMYTMHFYAATHEKWLRDKVDNALTKGIPIFVSECGGSEANGNGRLGTEEWKTYVDWMKSRNLSWVAWSISDKDETCSMLLPRSAVEENWTNLLKPWGKLARNSIIEANTKK